MFKVLIVGGAGFVGSHLAEIALRAGFEVHVIDDLSFGRKVFVPKAAKFHLLDICSPKLSALIKKISPHYVCQLAGVNVVSAANNNPSHDLSVAVVGTVNLLSALKDLKIKKFLYVSSLAVYKSSDKPIKENDDIEPTSFYALSRVTAEGYLNYYAENYGLPQVITRLTRIFGPRQLAGTMPRFVKAALESEPLLLPGQGESVRDYLYVTDAAQGIFQALQFGQGVYNLSTGEGISFRELALAIGQVIGEVPKVNYIALDSGEALISVFNSDKAQAQLNWSPQVPLIEGLRLTFKWWKEQGK